MLKNKLHWTLMHQLLNDEWIQCRSEGRDVQQYRSQVAVLLAAPDSEQRERDCAALMQKLQQAPVKNDFAFYEPVSYQDITAALPAEHSQLHAWDHNRLQDAMRGGWYGRAIGCLLGIPVECWHRARIEGYLKESGQFPLSHYISSKAGEEIRAKYRVADIDVNTCYDRQKICWINNVDCFPVDDDTNYTIAALKTVERFGRSFTSQDVAETWVYSVAGFSACTAERVAYRNIMQGILPPHSAMVLNPYREWIGAQIRGDFYGYVNPGNPCEAARMAYLDASVSHVKNGAYGEMLVAALIALSYDGTLEMPEIVRRALWQLPAASRLHRDVSLVVSMHAEGRSHGKIIDKIHSLYNETDSFDWCHTNSNAMIVIAGLLCYAHDFSSAICRTVEAGFDTDCNGATVGSILGVYDGFSSIDPKWYESLAPRLNSSVAGYYSLSFDELVKRSCRVCESNKT